jgi:hypothetical protein
MTVLKMITEGERGELIAGNQVMRTSFQMNNIAERTQVMIKVVLIRNPIIRQSKAKLKGKRIKLFRMYKHGIHFNFSLYLFKIQHNCPKNQHQLK